MEKEYRIMNSHQNQYLKQPFPIQNHFLQRQRSLTKCKSRPVEFRSISIKPSLSTCFTSVSNIQFKNSNLSPKVQISCQLPKQQRVNNQNCRIFEQKSCLNKNANQKVFSNILVQSRHSIPCKQITFNSNYTNNQNLINKSLQFQNKELINNQSKNQGIKNSVFQNSGSSFSTVNPHKELLDITFKDQCFLNQSEAQNFKFIPSIYGVFKNYSHQAFYPHNNQSQISQADPCVSRKSCREQRPHDGKILKQKNRHRRQISNMTQRIKKAQQNKKTINLQENKGKKLFQMIGKIGKQSRGSLFRFSGSCVNNQPFKFNRKIDNETLPADRRDCSQRMSITQQLKIKHPIHFGYDRQNLKHSQKKHKRTQSNLQQSNYRNVIQDAKQHSALFNNHNTAEHEKLPIFYYKQSQIKVSVPQIIEQNQTELSTKNLIIDQAQNIQQTSYDQAIKQSKSKIFSQQNLHKIANSKQQDKMKLKQKRAFTQHKMHQSLQENRPQGQILYSSKNTSGCFPQNSIEQNVKSEVSKSRKVIKESSLFAVKTLLAVSRTQCEGSQKMESTVINQCENDDLLQKIGQNLNDLKVDYKAIIQIRPNQQAKKQQWQQNNKKGNISCNNIRKNKREQKRQRTSMISIVNQLQKDQQNKVQQRKVEKSVKFIQNQQFTDKQFLTQNSIKTVRRLHIPNQYQKGKFLGKGYFGQVFFGKHLPTGMLCALKYLKLSRIKQQRMEESIERQIQCQIALNHPNICKIYQYFYDKHSDSLVLVVEFCQGKQLYHTMKQKRRLTQEQTAQIIHQLALAIEYMHKKHVIHRDLKPENIMISHGVTKLCDFGWAVMTTGSRKTICGTPLYSSPEIVMGKQYDKKVDLWGLGVLTYEMLIGMVPFKVYGQHQLHKIAEDQVTFPSWVDVSGKAQDFILRILHKDPDCRLNIFQIIDHPFLKRRKRVIERVSRVFPEFSSILLEN